MADSSGDKKHSASERRRRQAREEGQVVRSQDLTSAGMLLAAVGTLWMFGSARRRTSGSGVWLMHCRCHALSLSRRMTQPTGCWVTPGVLALAAVPLLLAMLVAGVLVNVTQTGDCISAPRKLFLS